jgi:hypothetical protein
MISAKHSSFLMKQHKYYNTKLITKGLMGYSNTDNDTDTCPSCGRSSKYFNERVTNDMLYKGCQGCGHWWKKGPDV